MTAVSRPRSSGTVGPWGEPWGLEDNSEHRNTPVVVSTTSVRPKPGDLKEKYTIDLNLAILLGLAQCYELFYGKKELLKYT